MATDNLTHVMTLTEEHEGTEEWYCPVCGRCLLVEWQPEFKREIIEAGDESVFHSGSRGLKIRMEIPRDDV